MSKTMFQYRFPRFPRQDDRDRTQNNNKQEICGESLKESENFPKRKMSKGNFRERLYADFERYSEINFQDITPTELTKEDFQGNV